MGDSSVAVGWSSRKLVEHYASTSSLIQKRWMLELLGAFHVPSNNEFIFEFGCGDGETCFRAAALVRVYLL
jgi:hypothetical protein